MSAIGLTLENVGTGVDQTGSGAIRDFFPECEHLALIVDVDQTVVAELSSTA